MFKPFVSIFRNFKGNFIVCATLLALLFVSFHSGMIVGEKKGAEEKEEKFKKSETLLKQIAKVENEAFESEISYLKGQLASLVNNNSKLKRKLGAANTKIETLKSQLQDISTKFNDLNKANALVVKEKNTLEMTLVIQRPFIDYSIQEDVANGGAEFTVYNKSTMPLKIVETDYQTLGNGIKGNEGEGIETIILYPDKNNINFTFTSSNMSKVTTGEIEFGGGFCVKYSTLNKKYSRYWIYEILFRYESVNKRYIVFSVNDNMVNSQTRCNVEKF